jgi:hypothetical protein
MALNKKFNDMKARKILCSFATGVACLALVGCEDEEKQVEIDVLTEKLERVSHDLESQEERLKAETEEADKLAVENDKLKGELRDFKRRAESAERELERIKARELAAREVKEREPTTMEKREAAKKAAAEHLNSVVSISGDQTSGSGTLVTADEKLWAYFPASYMVENSRLEITTSDGTKLDKFGAFEVASDADLVRLEIKEKVEGALSIAESVEIENGATVLGFGESGTIIEGRAYEVKANGMNPGRGFDKSDAGTPLFTGETTELFGLLVVANNAEPTLWPRPNNQAKNYEVSRIDRSIQWAAVPISTFMEEAKTLASADRLTRLVFAFAATRPSSSGIDTSGSAGASTSVSEILGENKELSAVKSLFSTDEWLKEKGERSSQADLNRRITSVYDDILRTSMKSTTKLGGTKFSPYHAKMAAQSLEWRKEGEKKLSSIIKSFE